MFFEKKYCAYSDYSERMFQGISMYFNIGILCESLRKCNRGNSYHTSVPRPRYIAGAVHNSVANLRCFEEESLSSCSSVANAFYTETQDYSRECNTNYQHKREKLSYDPVDYQQHPNFSRREECRAEPSPHDCAPEKSMHKLIKKKRKPKDEQSWENSCIGSSPKCDDRCAKSKKSVKQRISRFFKKRPICKKSCTVDKTPNYTKTICNSSPENISQYSPRFSSSIPHLYIGNSCQHDKPKKILKCRPETSSTIESEILSCHETASFDTVRNYDYDNADVQDSGSFTNKQSPAKTTQNPNSQSICNWMPL